MISKGLRPLVATAGWFAAGTVLANQYNLQPPQSIIAREIYDLHTLIMWIIVAIFVVVFGAMGLTPDTPLSLFWTWGRAMRFFDGPDEVHRRVVARSELDKAKANRGGTAAYYLLE